MIAPGFERLSNTYDEYLFYKVVGDKNEQTQAIMASENIRQVPTFVLYTSGARRKVVTGGAKISTMDIIDAIEELRWKK